MLDSELQPVGMAVGAEIGERLGAGIVVPDNANPYWDLATIGQRQHGLSVSFWDCSGGVLKLSSQIDWDLSPAAKFVEVSWAVDLAPSKFTFYATLDQQLYVSRVDFGVDSRIVESEPWRLIEADHDVSTVAIATEQSGPALWLFNSHAVVDDEAAEFVLSSLKGGAIAIERTMRVRLEDLPWQRSVVRPDPSQKSIRLGSVRSLHAESSPDRLTVWLRVIAAADGLVDKKGYEAVRIQVHKLPVHAFSGATGDDAATGVARCVAIFGESLTDEPVARTRDDFDSWTPWIANWGRQIFDVADAGALDDVDLVFVDKWSRRLEARNLALLRTFKDPRVLHARGPIANFDVLIQPNGLGVLMGGGIMIERDSDQGSAILFASRSRLSPWNEPFDFTGAQVEASARGEGTSPSITVFNLKDWKFDLIGAILHLPKHATSEGAKPAPPEGPEDP